MFSIFSTIYCNLPTRYDEIENSEFINTESLGGGKHNLPKVKMESGENLKSKICPITFCINLHIPLTIICVFVLMKK